MLNSVLEGAKRAAAEATAKGIRMAAKAVASKQSLPLGEAGEAVEQPKIGGLNKNLINRPPLVKRLSPDFMRVRKRIFLRKNFFNKIKGCSSRWL